MLLVGGDPVSTEPNLDEIARYLLQAQSDIAGPMALKHALERKISAPVDGAAALRLYYKHRPVASARRFEADAPRRLPAPEEDR